MVREGRCLEPNNPWSGSYIKGNINRSGECIWRFSIPEAPMSFRPLACGRQQGPGAWGAGMEAKLGDWCAARDFMLHRSKTASGDTAKLLVIIGVPD